MEFQLVLINTGTLELVEVTTTKPGVGDPRLPKTGPGQVQDEHRTRQWSLDLE